MGALVAGGLVLLGACSGSGDERSTATTTTFADVGTTVPAELAVGVNVTTPATLPVPDGFVAPDTRTVQLAPVIGKPEAEPDHSRPLLPVEGGTAKLHGTVFGPDGPVEGATVRLERFAGQDFGTLDLVTKKDGSWQAIDIMGGRYRVRAWHKPDLATVEPQAIFLAGDEGDGNIDLTMERYDRVVLQGAVDVPDPRVGQRVTFRALLTRDEVDGNGIVQGAGIGGIDIAVTPGDGVRVAGDAVARTGDDGFATFTVLCTDTGTHSVGVTSGEVTIAAALPECVAGEVDPADDPSVTPVAVNATFVVPFDGPVPAGTYVAVSPGNCATRYEAFLDGTWSSSVSLDRAIKTEVFTRRFEPLDGSTPCTYRRTA